jgi:hypothetical protein
MRQLAMACALLAAAPAGAQVRDTTAAADTAIDYTGVPRDLARDVRDVAEAPSTLRVRGNYAIETGSTVNGDVLALDGTLTVSGTVAGRIVAVDADVVFTPGSSVGGDVLAVRGTVTGQAAANVGGSVRVYSGGLRALADVVRGGAAEEWRWLRRWRDRNRGSGSEITLTTGRTYNRVEGLSILAGPTLRQRAGRALTTVRAFGVARTAHGLSLTSAGAGHLVTAEVRFGGERGLSLGGSSFDVVDAVEGWQLPSAEAGLAALALHRDYRDYFNRHGAGARLTLSASGDADLSFGYSDQRWTSADERDPFSILRNGRQWRANPRMDEGRFHLGTVSARVDTRNRVDNPWAGWYLLADYETGAGRIEAIAPTSDGARPDPAPGVTRYGRGFLDLRRYNRLAPNAQLNVRLVLGGWLHGDELPLQRRLSVGGPGTIPGFDFRRSTGREDVQQCSASAALSPEGRPAECDRVALAQAEYRGDLGLNIDPFAALRPALLGGRGTAGADDEARRIRGRIRSEWVVFFDAGRGWRVGERAGALRYPSGGFPALRTFRSDVGLGVLFGTGAAGFDQFGVYVAKAVSDASEPVNVFVRLRRRF